MVIWAAVMTAMTIMIIIMWGAYRRQIKRICRQLQFLKENSTRLRLTAGLPFPEMNGLIDGINDILDKSRELERTAQRSETDLKETITSLSHDIRTPLTSLDGYFQLLLQSDSEEEREHYIAIIQSRIQSLKDMLEELFTYTKLQNESYELSVERVDFGKCVYDTVFSFYDEFQRKGIEPKVDFCESSLPVNGNREAIRRTVQNIVKNALEHGQRQISMSLFEQGGEAVFRCANDVMHPEEIDMAQLFSRFYKADSARTRSSTGLGLSIAKELTGRMGGRVAASMEDGVFEVEVRMPLEDFRFQRM